MPTSSVVESEERSAPSTGRSASPFRRLCLAFAVVCVALLAVWAARQRSGPPGLLQKATPIAAWPPGAICYAWVADRQMLRADVSQAPGGLSRVTMVRIDLASGLTTPVAPVDRALASMPGGLAWPYPGLSEDGRWLVVTGTKPAQPGTPHKAATLLVDTRSGRTVDASGLYYRSAACPMPDGRHWLSVPLRSTRPEMRLYRVDGRSLTLERKIGIEGGDLSPGGATGLLGVARDGRVVVAVGGPGGIPGGGFSAVRMHDASATVERLAASTGATSGYSCASLSPDGRRVLLLSVEHPAAHGSVSFLGQQLHAWRQRRRLNRTLSRVSVLGLDDGQREDLATMENDWGDTPAQFAWTRDGRSVTFTYDGRLWRLPAP